MKGCLSILVKVIIAVLIFFGLLHLGVIDFIREKMRRNPSIAEMGLFCFLFLERTEGNYERYVKNIEFNGIKEHKRLKHHFFSSVPTFNSYEEFLSYSNDFTRI